MNNTLSLLLLVGGSVGIGIISGIIANAIVKKFPKATWAIFVVALFLAAGASFGWGYLTGVIIK